MKKHILDTLVAHFLGILSDGIAKDLITRLQQVPMTAVEALASLRLFIENATSEENKTYPLFVAKGAALETIKENELYLAEKDKAGESRYKDFGTFCISGLKIDRSRAYKNIRGSRIYAHLLSTGVTPLPKNFNQLEPLIPLSSANSLSAWKKALKQAGDDEVTGRHVKQVVVELGLRSENSTHRAKAPALTKAQFQSMRGKFETLIALPDTEVKRRREIFTELCEIFGLTYPVADSATNTKGDSTLGANPELNAKAETPNKNWIEFHQAKLLRPDYETIVVSFDISGDPRLAGMKAAANEASVQGDFGKSHPKAWTYRGPAKQIDAFKAYLIPIAG